MNEPIYGCAGCQNTAGAGGCPVHGQRVQIVHLERCDPIEAITPASLKSALLENEVRELRLQVEDLKKKLADEEKAHEHTMDERDAFEEVISGLAEDAGCEEEWSNLHAHGDCITNLWDAKVKEVAKSGM